MAEIQEQMKTKEREIPVFTVWKNNCILKNIFLLDKPPSVSSSPAEDVDRESEIEETLVVGRHPDCNIKLEHPSISRFHLRIHSKPSSRSLFVTDLTSVHGTWISGRRIEPLVRVKLNEGDMLHLGASSRMYRLNWVPLSRAYDIDDPFVPQLEAPDKVNDETDGVTDQRQGLSDNVEGQEVLLSDEDIGSTMQKMRPIAQNMPEDLHQPFSNEDEVEDSDLPEIYSNENELSSSQLCQLDTLVTDEETEGTTDQDEVNSHKPFSNEDEVEDSGLPEIYSNENELSSSQLCQLDTSVTVEETEGTTDLDEVSSHSANVEEQGLSDNGMEGLERLFSDEGIVLSMQNMAAMPESLLYSSFAEKDVTENNELTFVCNKENSTPQTHIPSAETAEYSGMNSAKVSVLQSIWSRRGKPKSVKVETSQSRGNCSRVNMNLSELKLKDQYESSDNTETYTADNENTSPDSNVVRSLKCKFEETLKVKSITDSSISSVDQDEEFFTSDKENMTPPSHLLKSMKNIGKSGEVKHPKSYRPSPLKIANNSHTYQDSKISKIHGGLKTKQSLPKARPDREPFYPLLMNSSDRKAKSHTNTTKVNENRWTVIADTTSLLNKKSRKELHLLRGLRGTTMIIPRIVVRELDCMLKRASFFSRMTEASAALKWIEECMAATERWVHVQSSAEEGRLIPPTPPAAASPRWLSEEKNVFSIGSVPFSPYSLQEIVTPTAADHILECALLFRRTTDGQLVLLSDDVALKIKAMAEGLICETAEEFRRSLVNPFSPRFLYSDSSPIGPTWSCSDDTVLKENYYPSPSKKSGDCKGLKLILLHNSNFRQMSN